MSLIDAFCAEYHTLRNVTPERAVQQARALRQFESKVGDLREADDGDLRDHLAELLRDGLAPSTVRQRLHMLRPFFKWAWQRRHIDADRLLRIEDVGPPRGSRDGGPRPYERKEIAKFWQQLDETWPLLPTDKFIRRWQSGQSRFLRVRSHAMHLQIEAIASLALFGGLRRNEIFRLELDDMHPESDVVIAHSRKNQDATWVARAIPMWSPMQAAIAAWFDFRALLEPEHGRPWLSLWSGRESAPLSRGAFTHSTVAKIGSGWELHRMRHTAATEMLRAQMPIEKVQLILGHATPQQTLAYTKLVRRDVMEAAMRAEGRYAAAIGRTKEAA